MDARRTARIATRSSERAVCAEQCSAYSSTIAEPAICLERQRMAIDVNPVRSRRSSSYPGLWGR